LKEGDIESIKMGIANKKDIDELRTKVRRGLESFARPCCLPSHPLSSDIIEQLLALEERVESGEDVSAEEAASLMLSVDQITNDVNPLFSKVDANAGSIGILKDEYQVIEEQVRGSEERSDELITPLRATEITLARTPPLQKTATVLTPYMKPFSRFAPFFAASPEHCED